MVITSSMLFISIQDGFGLLHTSPIVSYLRRLPLWNTQRVGIPTFEQAFGEVKVHADGWKDGGKSEQQCHIPGRGGGREAVTLRPASISMPIVTEGVDCPAFPPLEAPNHKC